MRWALALLLALPAFGSNPTFVGDFASGLDLNKWEVVSKTQDVAGAIPGSNKAVYDPTYVSVRSGVLVLKMTQERLPTGEILSTDSEIKSREFFGYGTYTFVMRMSSTAPEPSTSGEPVRGSVSAGWNYLPNSETEIDFEFRTDLPDVLQVTNWINRKPNSIRSRIKKQDRPVIHDLANGFHTYTFVWSKSFVTWYLDGKQIATHTEHVPFSPAQIVLNHWGTNSPTFGGMATPDVPRYMYIKKVSFSPVIWKGTR